ncbi:MAG TPA: bifunctional hydroxymethylpyrimidine kinase/phosphomethylpyrimidine kinase [Thermoanaerobaculia bacterium]|jgi:hydroxymethylpyrimidine/phosphomethylpyrimidine kinase|nr:bifunctional hydroxymethylpyrimidine kinase/phosphomethylpyrimidine kinase [Thermoanaerobaculia bacterium]
MPAPRQAGAREPGDRPPRLLTIAGSDSGGGAGIQADLKTFAAHGAYGMSVLTAVTAQNTLGVTAAHVLPVEIVRAQLDAVLADLGVDAIKVGMLATAAIVEAVADGLAAAPAVPIIVDPVMVAKGGASLLADDAVDALRARLLSLATVVTPNLPEAERLTGRRIASERDRLAACEALAAAGCAVLLKGGHGEGDEIVDLLWERGEVHRFAHPRQHTRATHGTGCTLSSAVAARLARGESLRAAVSGALEYLQSAIATAPGFGSGHGPLNHLP